MFAMAEMVNLAPGISYVEVGIYAVDRSSLITGSRDSHRCSQNQGLDLDDHSRVPLEGVVLVGNSDFKFTEYAKNS